jgi:tetratricopeptide (TPR) repeat protein
MKDPLVDKPTHYETLGVGEASAKAEIDGAFKLRLVEGKNVSEIREAWNALSKAVERGMVDIFLYNERFLQLLVPRADKDSTVLISRRREVAQAWETAQKNLFPHMPSIHCLAVLWLRWGVYGEEEKNAGLTKGPFGVTAGLSDMPPLDDIWTKVISNWVFIVTSDEFWQEWKGARESTKAYLGDGDLRALSQSLEGFFTGMFQGYTEKYRQHGDMASVRRHQEYELLYTTELKTARHLNKVGLQVPKGERRVAVSSGRLMLQEMGILENIKVQLRKLLELNPKEEKLRELLGILSPFAHIAVLVENRKYDEAMRAIEELPQDQWNQKEVKLLLARVCLEKGKQEFSLKQYDAALETWNKGLSVGELGEEIRGVVVAESKSRAASMQKSEPETAIKILKKAAKLVQDKELTDTLGEILTTRGIEVINEAQNKLQAEQKGLTPAIESELNRGIAYLKEAKDIGSKRGADNYDKAKDLVAQAKSGLLGLDPAVATLIQQAQEAAQKNDWDRAISLMTAASEKSPAGSRAALNVILAQFYNARGVSHLDSATRTMNTQAQGYQAVAGKLVDDFLAGKRGSDPGKKKSKGKSIFVWVLVILVVIGLIAGGKQTQKILSWFWIIFILLPLLQWLFGAIGKFFSDTNRMLMQNIPGQTNAPRCQLCSNSAAYQYNLPGKGEIALCYSHAEELRKIVEFVPRPDAVTADRIRSAHRDFSLAAGLNPAENVFRQNLGQAKEICDRFSLHFGLPGL